jgi:hypothetical protein
MAGILEVRAAMMRLLPEVGHLIAEVLDAPRLVARRSLTSCRRSATVLWRGFYPHVDRARIVAFSLELAAADPPAHGVHRDPQSFGRLRNG